MMYMNVFFGRTQTLTPDIMFTDVKGTEANQVHEIFIHDIFLRITYISNCIFGKCNMHKCCSQSVSGLMQTISQFQAKANGMFVRKEEEGKEEQRSTFLLWNKPKSNHPKLNCSTQRADSTF